MRRLIIAALLGSTALVPSAFAQTTGEGTTGTQPAAGAACDQLVTLLRDNPQAATAAGITAQRAQQLAEADDEEACRTALQTAQAGATGGTTTGAATTGGTTAGGTDAAAGGATTGTDAAAGATATTGGATTGGTDT